MFNNEGVVSAIYVLNTWNEYELTFNIDF